MVIQNQFSTIILQKFNPINYHNCLTYDDYILQTMFYTGNLGIKAGFLLVRTLFKVKIFIKSRFLFHAKCKLFSQFFTKKIKTRIKSEFLLYQMVPFSAIFLVTIKYSTNLYTITQKTLPYCLVKVKTRFLLPAQALNQLLTSTKDLDQVAHVIVFKIPFLRGNFIV